MCGIVGTINRKASEEQLLAQMHGMALCLQHRGPDNYGSFADTVHGVALGHRRLAIQDLSPLGNQPMQSRSGFLVIVFNGEIYNFKDIAAALAQEGIVFRGSSDTEVLLSAIEMWGLEKALLRCEGMFAFALLDKRQGRLFLCRDRMGEKPLYFGWHNGVFGFASELKALHYIFPERRNSICQKSLALFCSYGYIPAPYSINNGIYKLPQGCYASIDPDIHSSGGENWAEIQSDKFEVTPYWSMAQVVQKQKQDLVLEPGRAIDELESLLRATIRNQLIADVPVGAYLSGGVDSTLVAAIAHQESSSPLKTFTIGFNDKTFDEAPFARKIAATLGTEHYEKYVETSDVLNIVDDIPGIYCEPHANPSLLPSILVSRIARQNVTVCLSGDGGDELFGGYNRYYKSVSIYNKLNRFPKKIRNLARKLIEKAPLGYVDVVHRALLENVKGVGTEQSIALKIQKLANMLELGDIDEVYNYLVSTGLDTHELFRDPVEFTSPYLLSANSELAFEERAMLADQIAYLPDDNLAKVDRASMSCSLETRLPLLSHRLVEFSWRVPLQLKINDGVSKWILRELLARQVDRRLFERPKMGFSVPVAGWLRNELKEWMQDLLNPSKLQDDGQFNVAYINRLVEEHLSEKRDHANKLWTVLTFQAWREYQK